jgi:hypothetical protein
MITTAKTAPSGKATLRLHFTDFVGQPLLLANNRSATQSHTALLIYTNTFHGYRIANATNVIDLLNPTIIELRNMN